MPQNGEINLNEVKATYSVEDLVFVDRREVDLANEFRLTFEISFGIGLTLLGALLSEFDWRLLITAIIFLGFGLLNVSRYRKKYKVLKK